MRLGLVGCGGIGGSLALALRAAGEVDEVVGHDLDAGAAARALALGVVTRAGSLEDAVAGADVVVLAVPVRAIVALAPRIAALAGGAVVTDVGSTKAAIVRAYEGVRFVGGHPLAGTEKAGPEAASATLFQGRVVLLTPSVDAEVVARLWRAAGATVREIGADAHDRLVAAVSHLPHAVAYSLAAVVGAQPGVAGLAGSSFRDGTRVAETPPAMWIDIFLENRAAVLPLIDEFTSKLGALREAIAAGDGAAIGGFLDAGRAARARVL